MYKALSSPIMNKGVASTTNDDRQLAAKFKPGISSQNDSSGLHSSIAMLFFNSSYWEAGQGCNQTMPTEQEPTN
jgi:hypothetical protein